MPATLGASYLSAHSIRIHTLAHCAFYFIIKRGPSTSGLKFLLRSIQGGFALTTNIHTLILVFIIISRERHFSPLINNYLFLFLCQFILSHKLLSLFNVPGKRF